eukprot:SAG22_NODE_8_length_37215_cov_120.960351_3_plen_78_part_00
MVQGCHSAAAAGRPDVEDGRALVDDRPGPGEEGKREETLKRHHCRAPLALSGSLHGRGPGPGSQLQRARRNIVIGFA